MTLQVTVFVDRATAILAGHSAFGNQVVAVDPAALTVEEREELARAADESGRDSETIKLTATSGPWFYNSPSLPYPALATADESAVRTVLAARRKARDAIEAKRAAEAAAKAAEAAAKAAKDAAEQEAWLALPDSAVLVRPVGVFERTRAAYWVKAPAVNEGARVPAVQERIARLTAEAERQIATERAAEREQDEAKRRAEAEAKAARAAQIDGYVRDYCNPEQQRRAKAGLLGEAEILDAARAAIFAPLDSFPRFEKITRADIYAMSGPMEDYEEPAVEYATAEVTEATAEEFAVFEAIAKVAAEAIPYECKCQLVEHSGGLKAVDTWAVERVGVLVTVTDRALKFSREYATA